MYTQASRNSEGIFTSNLSSEGVLIDPVVGISGSNIQLARGSGLCRTLSSFDSPSNGPVSLLGRAKHEGNGLTSGQIQLQSVAILIIIEVNVGGSEGIADHGVQVMYTQASRNVEGVLASHFSSEGVLIDPVVGIGGGDLHLVGIASGFVGLSSTLNDPGNSPVSLLGRAKHKGNGLTSGQIQLQSVAILIIIEVNVGGSEGIADHGVQVMYTQASRNVEGVLASHFSSEGVLIDPVVGIGGGNLDFVSGGHIGLLGLGGLFRLGESHAFQHDLIADATAVTVDVPTGAGLAVVLGGVGGDDQDLAFLQGLESHGGVVIGGANAANAVAVFSIVVLAVGTVVGADDLAVLHNDGHAVLSAFYASALVVGIVNDQSPVGNGQAFLVDSDLGLVKLQGTNFPALDGQNDLLSSGSVGSVGGLSVATGGLVGGIVAAGGLIGGIVAAGGLVGGIVLSAVAGSQLRIGTCAREGLAGRCKGADAGHYQAQNHAQAQNDAQDCCFLHRNFLSFYDFSASSKNYLPPGRI